MTINPLYNIPELVPLKTELGITIFSSTVAFFSFEGNENFWDNVVLITATPNTRTKNYMNFKYYTGFILMDDVIPPFVVL